jgi:hypothetical protein
MPNDWEQDEYSQEMPDYTGGSGIHMERASRKRSGKSTPIAHAAACRRWRRKHISSYRAYQRAYQAARRAALKADAASDA